jgi:ketosteroid isomerase-like protein
MHKITKWLSDFSSSIRGRDFVSASKLHVDDAVMFGTKVIYSRCLSEYSKNQWEKIWNSSRDFEFTEVLIERIEPGLAFCATLWKNQTYINGIEKERFGRATFVFRLEGDELLCIHSHFSESPNHA